MIENRRCSNRLPVVLIAVLSQNNQVILGGKTRNISMKGLFVETGPVTLAPGTRIDVQLNANEGSMEPLFHAEAEVVHRSCEGMGLAFRDPIPDHFLQQCRSLLLAQSPAAPVITPQRGVTNPYIPYGRP